LITVGSLFAGIGGLELGLEWTGGFETVWQCEIDDYATKVLEKHWPDVRRCRDVRTFPPEPIDEWQCDLICGGFPCKQTSVAAAIHGRRRGLGGTDSRLWYAQLGIIDALRPKWAIIENPAGAKTWARKIEGCLEAIGYAVSRQPVSSWGVGGPHLRRRVFWIANRDGQRLPIARLPDPPTFDSIKRGAVNGNAWRKTLSGVLRVADGIPGRMDRRARIECLGNAVVPQVAQWIGQRILEADAK